MTFTALAQRLTRRAAARAERRLLARRRRGIWYRADLLWPLFGKGGE